jgi:probable rRNA maturation factor
MPSLRSALLFQVATPGLPRRGLRAFLKRLEREVGQGRGFCCLIASDSELQRLNRDFRKRDYATDVLSFPSENSELADESVCPTSGAGAFACEPSRCIACGEIAISYDAAQRQSAAYGHSVEQEIKILMLHGLLHLLGMDHETDHGRMLTAEREWRIRLGLPAGLIERVSA